MDPTLKKLLFALIAVLLTVVATFAQFDRTDIKGDATTALSNSNDNREEIGLVKNEQEHLKTAVKDLKGGQKVIVKGMQEIIRTLYTLPSERRLTTMPVLEVPTEEEPDE